MTAGHFQASIGNLVQLLSRQLYSGADVFLRELVCNSYDALLRRGSARKRVVIRADRNTVTVYDEGIGMDRRELSEVLSCLGRSKTADETSGRVIGQFGIGFFSALAVAKQVDVYTKSVAGDGESLHWQWKGGQAWRIEPCAPREPGTTVVVTLREEHSQLAIPTNVADSIRRQMPFLPLDIIVPPVGDPRPGPLLWHTSANAQKVDRDIDAQHRALLGPSDHMFMVSLPKLTALLAFPSNIGRNRGIEAFNHGVRIESARALLGHEWDWVAGLVSFQTWELNLSRGSFMEGGDVDKILDTLKGILRDELIYLATREPRVFKNTVTIHRDSLLRLANDDNELGLRIGQYLPFSTTRGDWSFHRIAQYANQSTDSVLYYVKDSPLSDARWALMRDRGELAIWCRSTAEECVLKLLAAGWPGLHLKWLTWGDSALKGKGIAPLSAQATEWLARLRRYLKPYRVAADVVNYEDCRFAAIVEFPFQSPTESDSRVDNTLAHVFSFFEGEADSPRQSCRLQINVANATVSRMMLRSGSDVALEAAVLFAGGAARSGLAVPAEWQSVIDQLTRSAMTALAGVSSHGHAETHITCFFAHEFRSHKTLLSETRAVLEHAPYFWEVRSADELTKHPRLFDNVQKQIEESHIVLGEITSGNPNVLLEVGLAYGLDAKLVMLLTERARFQPFSDLRGHIVFQYGSLEGEATKQQFRDDFRAWLSTLDALRSIRAVRPFMGFRLVVEAGLVNWTQVEHLRRSGIDLEAFAKEDPGALARQLGLKAMTARRLRSWAVQRLDDYRSLSIPFQVE